MWIGSCTIMQVGDDRDTPFWEIRWIQGAAPKELAPNLFKLARYKNRSVRVELQNLNWIRSLRDLENVEQLEELVMLFMASSRINLTYQNDKIIWGWTPDSKYTIASAYECQFHGSMTYFPAPII
jgi:hypothetical protein